MNALRVGIVGCGEVAQIIHLPSLYQLNEHFQVTALCDASPTVLNAVGDTWRIEKRFADYADLVAQDDVDVVLVASPHAYHAQTVLAAIAADKHVLVEKPMCLTLREADEIVAAAAAKPNLVVQVAYMRRYAPAFEEACRLTAELDSIRLARVHAVIGHNAFFINDTSRVVRSTDVPAAAIAAGKRLQDEAISEAIGADAPPVLRKAYLHMLGLSSHDLSAMRELLGMPQRVLYAAQRQDGIYISAAFDYGDYICHFETGIDEIARFDAYLEVYSGERVLRVQYDTPYVRNLPIRLMITEANGQGGVIERTELPTWGDAFVAEWRALYGNITERRAPKTTPADFRQDLALFAEMITRMGES